ncbi:hypothetical protein GCM10007304_24680 [Rhodococcoides trifolii]|uniref:Uncharacterized protein n=1 Tax=Rhodococcoides trifolii TaxID=908250 RepID=A0A917FWV3_9NOCA|nr:hypothetical protein [Rhodococcus trifolii]GGG09659.1 hypothetical protein GCM10007304_24680 [Rhodococcus trifolii]
MDNALLDSTRRALHAVAERLIAGPQYAQSGTIRLAVSPRGFGGVSSSTSVDGTDLVTSSGRTPISGSIASTAAAAGIRAVAPSLYEPTAELGDDDALELDPECATLIANWLEQGDRALRAFAPDETPVLWPEHFDLAVSVGEVTFGVSPGDASSPRPYAYVSPWTPRTGSFWNASFGAARSIDEVGEKGALADFFQRGRAKAASD